MKLSIELLGSPRALWNDVEVEARGRKVWALLAYLARSERPKERPHLAQMFFPEADDPLRALRWNLTELRRILGDAAVEGTDAISLVLPPEAHVDVHVVTKGSWAEALAVAGLGREFLEGFDAAGLPHFEPWLLHERRHLIACCLSILREAATAQLASGDVENAIRTSSRATVLDPLDEESQALLIRCYMTAGDRRSALRQASSYTELCRDELGSEPGDAITSAMDVSAVSVARPPIRGAAAVRAQLEAGRAAIKAGALESGLDCLRRASAEASACRDAGLEVGSLHELGSALAHAGRERHGEATVCLHAALDAATRAGDRLISASCMLELAWIEFMSARYERVDSWVSSGLEAGAGDAGTECSALWIRGKCSMERGRFQDSIADLSRAVELAHNLDPARRSFCNASLGRTFLLERNLKDATGVLDEAIRIGQSGGFTWVLPLPTALRGEVALLEDDIDLAAELIERAYVSAVQVGDRSFEALARRGLGLLLHRRGRSEEAIAELEAAYQHLAARPDCEWILAYVLDALCEIATDVGSSNPRWLNDLESMAARTGMKQMLAHVYLYRDRLGVRGAIETARVIATEIDNPYLDGVLAESSEAHV